MRSRLTMMICLMLVVLTLAACSGVAEQPVQNADPTESSQPALAPVTTSTAVPLPLPSATPLTTESGADDQLTIATQQPYPGAPSVPATPQAPVAAAEPYPEGTPQSLTPIAVDAYPPGGDGPVLAGELLTEPAGVEQITLTPIETFPFQLEALVEGNHPDACWRITRAVQTREGNTLRLDVTASRSADAVCAAALSPFGQTYMLDINGLPQGVYIIDVNGVTTEFVLPVDNFLR